MDRSNSMARIEAMLTMDFFCTTEQLRGNQVAFTVDTETKKPRIGIMAYRNCVIVCTSADLSAGIRKLLQGRSRDEIFELPYVYGQTIHYVPGDIPDIAASPKYSYEFLFGDEVSTLNGLKGFDNSLAFDENGRTPTTAAYIARYDGEIVGVAGASTVEMDGVLEVGVDVMPEHRNARLGTYLVRELTIELLVRDILPFYSASVTNIGSQMVASRCGYIPAWVDTFGNTLDGSSIYDGIVRAMPSPGDSA